MRYLLSIFVFWTLISFTASAGYGNCWVTRMKNAKQFKSKVRGVNIGGLTSVNSDLIGLLYSTQDSTDITNTFLNSTYGLSLQATSDTLPTLTLQQWTRAAQTLGLDVRTLLRQQWDLYFNEVNFALMARARLNSVRINVGWWTIFNGTGSAAPYGYVGGDLNYVDNAFQWANKYGLAVLLNVQYLVGQAETPNSQAMWASTSVTLSQQAVQALVTRFGTKPALLGFQLADSPIDGGAVQTEYYRNMYKKIRAISATSIVVLGKPLSTAIAPTVMNPPTFTRVWTELHLTSSSPSPPTPGPSGLGLAVTISTFQTQIQSYAMTNNFKKKGKPLLIVEWGPPSGPLLSDLATWKQFLSGQGHMLEQSKNAGWFYSAWIQSPTFESFSSYLSLLMTVIDISLDTESCPIPFLCRPVYPASTQNPNPQAASGAAYLNAVGQCGQCGIPSLGGVLQGISADPYVLIGCYNDSAVISDFLVRQNVSSELLTLDMCNNLCYSFQFFGVQSDGVSSFCSCGDFYGSYGSASSTASCDLSCPGNPDEMCGGVGVNAVYQRKTKEVLCSLLP